MTHHFNIVLTREAYKKLPITFNDWYAFHDTPRIGETVILEYADGTQLVHLKVLDLIHYPRKAHLPDSGYTTLRVEPK